MAIPPIAPDPGYSGPSANGLVLLIGIVLLGVASGAGLYQWQKPRADNAVAARLAEAMSTEEGRVQEWYRYGSPQIHHRIANVARFSDEQPWLVTFAIESEEGEHPTAWGIVLPDLPRELAVLEGTTVVIPLPAPAALGPIDMSGGASNHVEVYEQVPSEAAAAARLTDLALWFLEGLPAALEEDIEGARIEVRVAPREVAGDAG